MSLRWVWLAVVVAYTLAVARVAAQEPKTAADFFSRGLAWYEKGEYDKAIKDYDEAVRLNPKDDGAFFNRGVAWKAKGENEKAEKDFAEAKRLRELKK
jgi:tetratricopeptide (TPR) repeat protein